MEIIDLRHEGLKETPDDAELILQVYQGSDGDCHFFAAPKFKPEVWGVLLAQYARCLSFLFKPQDAAALAAICRYFLMELSAEPSKESTTERV